MIDMETVQYRILSYMSEDESFKNLSLKDSMRLVRIFQETMVNVEMEDYRRRDDQKYGWEMLLFEEAEGETEKAREDELHREAEEKKRIFAEQREMAKQAEQFYAEQAKLGPIAPVGHDPLKVYRLKKEDPENHKFWE